MILREQVFFNRLDKKEKYMLLDEKSRNESHHYEESAE